MRKRSGVLPGLIALLSCNEFVGLSSNNLSKCNIFKFSAPAESRSGRFQFLERALKNFMSPADTKSKVHAETPLIPDIALLIEARVKAGEKNVQMKAITNLILHDPVLTIEFLHYANSIMYGGAPVTDVEAAVTRLGTKRLVSLLSELNAQTPQGEPEVLEAFEILRYNCRRFSIISLILAGVLQPGLVALARTAGLFADIGHMLALLKLGKVYCETAKKTKRQMLPFRLQKDHKFDVNKELVRFLTAKSIPLMLIRPYEDEENVKKGSDMELRLIVQSARELIEAYDSGKWLNYSPNRPLPANSALRVLKTLPFQQQRIFQACQDYLKLAAAEEAPEGASLLISAVEGEELQPLDEAGEHRVDSVLVPKYPNLSITPKSREALKEFLEIIEKEQNELRLRDLSVQYLKKSGVFARTALLRVSPDGSKVTIENSAGLEMGPGAEVPASGPHSPFKQLQVEVRSAAMKSDQMPAPFGTTAYGLGPVDVLPSGDRLALYVDRSAQESLTMESRRVFRLVLGLVSQSLQAAREEKRGQTP